jgi:hypothetical protein
MSSSLGENEWSVSRPSRFCKKIHKASLEDGILCKNITIIWARGASNFAFLGRNISSHRGDFKMFYRPENQSLSREKVSPPSSHRRDGLQESNMKQAISRALCFLLYVT